MKKLLIVAAIVFGIASVAQAADSYVNLDKISVDAGFDQRVAYAMIAAAIAIANEAPSPTHAVRAAYAKQVLSGSFNLQQASLAVLAVAPVSTNALFATGSPGFGVADTDIATAVSSVWNSLAGAF